MRGTYWHPATLVQPPLAQNGDCYYDKTTQEAYSYFNGEWLLLMKAHAAELKPVPVTQNDIATVVSELQGIALQNQQ